MKRVNEIFDALKGKNQFKSVQKYSCYNSLLGLLPPRFQKAVAFFYIKNNTLFGALKHPGYKMELNYNKDLVKALLKEISKIKIECRELFENVKNVEFFVSKFYTPPPLVFEDTDPKYRELASGNFEIKAQDGDLIELFKKIQEDIRGNKV